MIDNLEHVIHKRLRIKYRTLKSFSNSFLCLVVMNGNRRYSSRSFKTKRLSDAISKKSFVPQPILQIPRLSKASFQRWSEAQVAYLGPAYPYVQEPKRHRRRHSRRMTKPEMESISNWTLESSISLPKTADRKSIGIETDEIETIKYNDEAIQTIPSPPPVNDREEDENTSPCQSEHLHIDHCDKTTETDNPPEINGSRVTIISCQASMASSIYTTSSSIYERIQE